jgi:hypothetical protein
VLYKEESHGTHCQRETPNEGPDGPHAGERSHFELGGSARLIHIEYSLDVSLDYVKIWQLIAKGAWSLICEYRASPQSAPVSTLLTFSNGYHSEGLAQMLEVIMQHQADFVPSKRRGVGLVQVTRPNEEEKQPAKTCMKHAYNHLALTFEHIPGAAVA